MMIDAPRVLMADGRVPLTMDRAFCELLDTMINTLPLLDMRWELVCEVCVAVLGPVQRRGDPSPDIFLSGLELADGTVEMVAQCHHARRVYTGPYTMPPAVITRALTRRPNLTYRLPKSVRDLVVRVDRELRARSAQMRLFCTICEDKGLEHRDAAVRGDNERVSGVFRMRCAHAVRECL